MKISVRTWVIGAAAAAGLLGVGVAAVSAQGGPDLDQGWDKAAIDRFASTSTGSRLVPEQWLRALEQPGSTALFLDPAHLDKLGYLGGPNGLPLGFALDSQSDEQFTVTRLRWKGGQGKREPWVGMTCAACHTAELKIGSTVLRVQGGPGLGDFQGLMDAYIRTLYETSTEAAKFDRFAGRILGPRAKAGQVKTLRNALGRLAAYETQIAGLSKSDLRYGFGRMDMASHSLNRAAFVANLEEPASNGAEAPVSYPHLWNAQQLTRLGWTGLAFSGLNDSTANRMDTGALARNIAETIGVFGEVQPPKTMIFNYTSSIEVNNLITLQQQLGTLKPPKWPRQLAAIDEDLVKEGRGLFEGKCASCHAPLDRADLKTRKRANGDPLDRMAYLQPRKGGEAKADTDTAAACTAPRMRADAGALKGQRATPFLGDVLTRSSPSTQIMKEIVTGVLVDKRPDASRAAWDNMVSTDPVEGRSCNAHAASANGYADMGYKARPLNGIWATGPYLHNGSVPSLYDLLLPAKLRPTSFGMGSRQFDPKKVGFMDIPGGENRFTFETVDDAGKPIVGNSNAGHDYGAALTERERLAILEYLKVIGE